MLKCIFLLTCLLVKYQGHWDFLKQYIIFVPKLGRTVTFWCVSAYFANNY